MTQNRRRPTPGGGSRRPQVAGLRKPSPRPRPTPQPRPDAEPDITPDTMGAQPIDTDTDTTDTDTGTTDTDTDTTDAEATDAGTTARGAAAPAGSPRPRAKSRDGGIRKPETPDEAVSQASALPDAARRQAKPKREAASWPMTTVIGSVALVLALVAAFFAFKYFTLEAGDENQAMVDVVATEELKQQVSDGLEAMFSFDYNNVEQHEQDVKDVLATGAMREKYEQLMGDVKEKAPQQKVVLQTAVRNIAVIEMDGNTARVLAFIDQTSVREDTGQSAATGDQPTVTAMRIDGEWKIADVDVYADPRNRAPVPGEGESGNDGGDN